MNSNRGHYAFAPLNNMKNKRAVQASVPAGKNGGPSRHEEPVRRSSVLSLVVTFVLPVLFLLALFIGNTLLQLVFLAAAAIAVLAMWVMNVFARAARSTLSIVYVALMVVISVALILSQQTPELPAASSQSNKTVVQDWTQSHYTATASATPAAPAAYKLEETTTSAAQKQLESFILGWRDNDIGKMLVMCSPAWVAQQTSPEAAVWNTMRNRYPTEYTIENVDGSEADSSRVITVKITFENHGTGDVTTERMHVLMLRINDNWYVDPQSLNGSPVDEAAEQARAEQDNQRIQTTKAPVTPTPKPTGDAAMQLYYNPDGGRYYHSKATCPDVAESYWPLSPFYYGDLNTQKFVNLMQCSTCNAPPRP